VLGSNANSIKAVPDTFDPAKVMLTMSEGGTDRLIAPGSLGGGSLSGLLKFQNEDLTAAKNLIGQLATAVSGAVNTQQSLGLDLGQPAGTGAPIFSVGDSRVLGAMKNTGTAALSLTVTDTAAVQASDYALSFDGTSYNLTRASDQSTVAGSPFTPAQLLAGVQFDGVNLQLTGGTPATNDRFLLQPVANAAQSMQTVLSSTNGIAAASPFTASLAVGNKGTANVASMSAVDPSFDGTLSANITFTSDTGDYTWTMSDASTGTGTWTPGAAISLNGFDLKLDGVPKSGDAINVVPTVSVSSNNGNALAFARLASAAVVAASGGAGSSAGGQTVTDAYASAIANIGVRVQSGKTASTISTAVASEAESARVNKSGVNLDEEAARLIQFQQSYQAAAKILQVAQQIFDTMLQAASGS
jgi:flagellar hook-associated protein 1 FlgK